MSAGAAPVSSSAATPPPPLAPLPASSAANSVERVIQPCNFRSAGRLSNESARTLRQLHELLARNLMNTLDVYLGDALDVKLTALEQFTMDEYRARLTANRYLVPCAVNPGSHVVLLEAETALLFTIIDLLLGGSGQQGADARELTEIDEEIVRGFSELILQQVEKAWGAIEVTLALGSPVRPSVIHKLFAPTEKMLVVSFEVSLGGVSGALHLGFPATIGGHLVRNIKADNASGREPARFSPRLPLEARMLDCRFVVQAGLPQVRVPVRELAAISVGSIFHLGTAVDAAGLLLLEGRAFFEASPVRSGRRKALELLAPITDVQPAPGSTTYNPEANSAPAKEKR